MQPKIRQSIAQRWLHNDDKNHIKFANKVGVNFTTVDGEEEIRKFKQKNISVNTSLVAKDAIAIIVNKNFNDSSISINQLKQLLSGNDSFYVKGRHINVVFDNQNSGSARHLKDSLLEKINFGKNCSALKNTPELIKSISQNTLSIGICDFAWLSDKDDLTTKAFLKTVILSL